MKHGTPQQKTRMFQGIMKMKRLDWNAIEALILG
jgi:hypothetical protein